MILSHTFLDVALSSKLGQSVFLIFQPLVVCFRYVDTGTLYSPDLSLIGKSRCVLVDVDKEANPDTPAVVPGVSKTELPTVAPTPAAPAAPVVDASVGEGGAGAGGRTGVEVEGGVVPETPETSEGGSVPETPEGGSVPEVTGGPHQHQ